MAISTSVNSVLLPDFGDLLQSAMNTSLDTSQTMLTLLLNSSSAAGLQTVTEGVQEIEQALSSGIPGKNALPTFAFFSNYGNQPAAVVYDSEMQPIYGGNFSTATDGEVWASQTGTNYTNSTIGSSSGPNSFINATPWTQTEGNWVVKIPGAYGSNFQDSVISNYHQGVQNVYPILGTVIGASGVRQPISIYHQGTTLQVYPFAQLGYLENVPVNSATYSTWAGTSNAGQNNVSYNARTNTLVVIEPKDAANSYRLHYWRNVNRQLSVEDYKTGTLHQFLSEAKAAGTPASLASSVYYFYNDFTWNANSSASYTESRYRMVVVAGDNGIVGLTRMIPSNGIFRSHIVPSFATTSATPVISGSIGSTTTYGLDSGASYGIRSQITWSNQWVASYSPYYYYGSGILVTYTNTVDPSKYYLSSYTSSSSGSQLLPYQEGKFLHRSSETNADGEVGGSLWVVDLEGTYAFGRTSNGSVIANGGTLSMTQSRFAYQFDTRTSSTNYPTLISPQHWTNG